MDTIRKNFGLIIANVIMDNNVLHKTINAPCFTFFVSYCIIYF